MHTGVFGLDSFSLFSYSLLACFALTPSYPIFLGFSFRRDRCSLVGEDVRTKGKKKNCGRWVGRVCVVACIRGEIGKREGKEEKE